MRGRRHRRPARRCRRPARLLVDLDRRPSGCPSGRDAARSPASQFPRCALAALEASAPFKVEAALRLFGLTRLTAAPRPQRILLVTGLSGAGKSTVLRTLEDLGWETVDNLPLSLLEHLLATPPRQGRAERRRPLAHRHRQPHPRFRRRAASSSRSRRCASDHGFPVETLYSRLRRRRADPPLFRDPAAPPARPRPPGHGRHRRRARADGAAAALGGPCRSTPPTRRPTHSSSRCASGSAAAADAPTLTIMSFGFARGVPRNADIVFDMRFLRNPHWDDGAARPDRARRSGRRPISPPTKPMRRRSTRIEDLLLLSASPLSRRRKILCDDRVRLYGRAPPLGPRRRASRGTVARSGIFAHGLEHRDLASRARDGVEAAAGRWQQAEMVKWIE